MNTEHAKENPILNQAKQASYELFRTTEYSSDGQSTVFRMNGFKNTMQAEQWAQQWVYENYGYSPSYTIQSLNDKISVFCRHYNSCD